MIVSKWSVTASCAIMVLVVAGNWLSVTNRVDNLAKAFEAGQTADHELLEQVKSFSEQARNLSQADVDLSKKLTSTADDNKKMGEQLLGLARKLDTVLGEHTETLKKAAAKAQQAVNAATENQVLTRRAIREIQPKPKPNWWQRLTK